MIDRIICRLFGHLWVEIKCPECGTGLQNFHLTHKCGRCKCWKTYRHGHVYGCPTHGSAVYECARCSRLEYLRD